LTVGVNSAVRVYRDSTRLYEAETLCGTVLTCLEDEFRYGRDIKTSGKAVTTFDSQTFGNDVKVSLDGEGKVKIGVYQLLSKAAYTSELEVSGCNIEYESGKVAITVTVKSEVTKASVTHTVRVSPLNS